MLGWNEGRGFGAGRLAARTRMGTNPGAGPAENRPTIRIRVMICASNEVSDVNKLRHDSSLFLDFMSQWRRVLRSLFVPFAAHTVGSA